MTGFAYHTTPLVGREREQAALRDHLAAALDGRGSLVLIGGEAGIGKTALAEALCREAANQGALVLVGRCYDLTETPPYGPWTELFDRYIPDGTLPGYPAAFATRGAVPSAPGQGALFRQVIEFFAAVAVQRPLLLLLEDLHWSDEVSLDLLRFLARSLTDLPLLLVATHRSDEITRRHPLYTLLPLLVREAGAERLDLHPLGERAIRALVEARYALPDADARRLVAHLQHHAEGNALFLTELLRALEEQGTLAEDGAGWQLGDLRSATVSALLKQVIGGRVARLGEEARHLLGVAAVVGQEVPLDVWAVVAGVDEDTLTATVERAVEVHLLAETPDGTRARFVHALIREALYEDLLPSRRRRLHLRVAEALEREPTPDFDALASHFQRAGDDARAERWLVVAGERAFRAQALMTAAARFEAAQALVERRGGHPAERGWLLLRRAHSIRYRDPQRGLRYLEEAGRLADTAGDAPLAAAVTQMRGLMGCMVGRVREGLADMQAANARLRTFPWRERPWLRGNFTAPSPSGEISFRENPSVAIGIVVMWLAYAGRFAEALAQAEAFRTDPELRAPPTGPPWIVAMPATRSDAIIGVANAHGGLGHPREAHRAYEESRRAYERDGNQLMLYLCPTHEFHYVHLPYEADRVEERRRLLDEAARAWELAWDMRPDLPDALVGSSALRFASSWPRIGDLLPGIARSGIGVMLLQTLGQFVYWQGDADVAASLVAEMLPDGPATEPGDCRLFDVLPLLRVGAALSLDSGDAATARAWLEGHDRWLAWSGAVPGRAEGQVAWAAYYRATGDAALAREHVEQARSLASEPRQPLALLSAHRMLGELETDAGRYGDARQQLDAALALADACAAPFDRALNLMAMAELHAAMGQPGAALPLLDEVRRIGTPLHTMPLLTRADALAARLAAAKEPSPAYPAGLSAREVEVLRLLAAGRTNREIADALFLSIATVNNHVAHILTKTNTENRAAAAAYAQRHGLA